LKEDFAAFIASLLFKHSLEPGLQVLGARPRARLPSAQGAAWRRRSRGPRARASGCGDARGQRLREPDYTAARGAAASDFKYRRRVQFHQVNHRAPHRAQPRGRVGLLKLRRLYGCPYFLGI
jgi:hypothetical protein